MLLFLVVSDSTNDRQKSYNIEVSLADTADNYKAEHFAPSGITSGLQQADIIGTLPVLSLARALPTKPNDQPTMNSFMQFVAAMIAAALSVLLLQTALESPLQSHNKVLSPTFAWCAEMADV